MSLAAKLYISLFFVMFVCLAVFTYYNVTDNKRDQLELVKTSALSTVDLIRNSIHYSMLINRKEDIDQIFKNFEPMSEFKAIRILDKSGRIIFTTIPDEARQQVAITSEACKVCHSHTDPPKVVATKERVRMTTSPEGEPVLAVIKPIANEPACARRDCHVSPEERAVLGVLDVQMSLDIVQSNIARYQRQMIIASAVLVGIVLVVVGLLIWSLIRVPVRTLMQGTKIIAAGDLDHTIPIRTGDEMGELAGSFNSMVSELKKARTEITVWSDTLQEKVEEKTDEVKRMQSHLVHVEKMASLGKLAATVAHELNNPLEGIVTYAHLTQKRLRERELTPQLVESILEDVGIMGKESMRCGDIVRNLLLFSKRQLQEYDSHDVQRILSHCLQLIDHHLKLNDIKLVREYESKSIETMCDRNQLQQALLAFLMNAVESMQDRGGTLTVGARMNEDTIRIAIKDTGCGISEEDKPFIFEPFYSGKKDGKGVGLGLSVAYGIVEGHGGRIEVLSKEGEGSTFITEIPQRAMNPLSSFEATTQIPKVEGDASEG